VYVHTAGRQLFATPTPASCTHPRPLLYPPSPDPGPSPAFPTQEPTRVHTPPAPYLALSKTQTSQQLVHCRKNLFVLPEQFYIFSSSATSWPRKYYVMIWILPEHRRIFEFELSGWAGLGWVGLGGPGWGLVRGWGRSWLGAGALLYLSFLPYFFKGSTEPNHPFRR
jgi:hypothetical protein